MKCYLTQSRKRLTTKWLLSIVFLRVKPIEILHKVLKIGTSELRRVTPSVMTQKVIKIINKATKVLEALKVGLIIPPQVRNINNKIKVTHHL